MTLLNLPSPLDKVFAERNDMSVFFDRLMASLAQLLDCDRCYLYLRDPKFYFCQIPHCYCAVPEIPDLRQTEKKTESFYSTKSDPLLAAAFNCSLPIFIEDLEQILNRLDNKSELLEKRQEEISQEAKILLGTKVSSDNQEWKQEYVGQKSLIQAPIYQGNRLWRFIQAAQFNRRRPWTKFDRSLVSLTVDRITPLITMYVKRKLRETTQVLHDGYQ